MGKRAWAALWAAGALACADQAAAAVVLQFEFDQPDPALNGSLTATLAYYPVFNATLPNGAVSACSVTYLGTARSCLVSAALPDVGGLISEGLDLYDAFVFSSSLTPLDPNAPIVPPSTYNSGPTFGGSYFYFENGAFSHNGTYQSLLHTYASTATLTVSGYADAVQIPAPPIPTPIPEPSTWAMLILGFCGIGALVHRSKGHRRAHSKASYVVGSA